MKSSILAGIVAAVVTLALTPLFRHIGRRLGWTDTPNQRSSHLVPTPRNGGKAIMLGITAAVVLAGIFYDRTLTAVLLLAGALSLVGAVDDAKNLRWRVKMAVQLAAAAGILWLVPFRTGPALALLAVFWLTGVTNAFNFMDGVNGIASLHATICGATMGLLLLASGDVSGAGLSFAVAGAAFGFFLWNGFTGSIFMGDVGSLPLGFLLAVLVLRGATVGVSPWVMALPLLPFLLDTGVTLVRRTLRRERIFEAHRTHYYQQLTDLGWSHLEVTLLWGGLATTGAVVALAWKELGLARFAASGCVVALHLVVFAVITKRRAASRIGRPGAETG